MVAPLTTKDVARRLDLSEDRVRELERSGQLPATRTRSGLRLWTTEDVERFAEERAGRTERRGR